MRVKKLLGPVLLAGMLFACSEGVGPDAHTNNVLLSNEPNMVKWGFDSPPSFSAELDTELTGSFDGDSPVLATAAPGSLILDTHELSFWAVRGEVSYVRINVVDYSQGYQQLYPFVSLMVRAPAQLADGTEIAVGDSVNITLSVDPVDLSVQLTPHGLIFDESLPTMMRFWYVGALGDLNGDGVVDDYDTQLEDQLALWYQADESSPWAPTSSYHSTSGDYFHLYLDHFSGYGVAW